MLGKLFNGKDWYKALPEIEFAINNTVSQVTGVTPSRLLYGVPQRGCVSSVLKDFIEGQNEPVGREIEKIRAGAVEKIKKASEYNESYVNRKRKKAYVYSEGDLVMLKNFESSGGKLVPAFKGPYHILRELRNDRYVVADVEGCQMSQTPYQGTWEASNMRP